MTSIIFFLLLGPLFAGEPECPAYLLSTWRVVADDEVMSYVGESGIEEILVRIATGHKVKQSERYLAKEPDLKVRWEVTLLNASNNGMSAPAFSIAFTRTILRKNGQILAVGSGNALVTSRYFGKRLVVSVPNYSVERRVKVTSSEPKARNRSQGQR